MPFLVTPYVTQQATIFYHSNQHTISPEASSQQCVKSIIFNAQNHDLHCHTSVFSIHFWPGINNTFLCVCQRLAGEEGFPAGEVGYEDGGWEAAMNLLGAAAREVGVNLDAWAALAAGVPPLL